MKKTLLSIALVCPLFFCSCNKTTGNEAAVNETTEAPVEEVVADQPVAPQKENFLLTPTEFKAKMTSENAVIIDVRTPPELKREGYIEGSTHIDFSDREFSDKIAALDKNKEYYVYCHAGGRSGKAKQMMDKLGFAKVYDLKGGITAWLAEGQDVIK